MKEPLSALSITLIYDGMAATCTTSTDSMSLDHFHAWHRLRGVEKRQRTKKAAAPLEDRTQDSPHLDSGVRTGRGHPRMRMASASAGCSLVTWSLHVCRNFRPYPVQRRSASYITYHDVEKPAAEQGFAVIALAADRGR